MELTNFKFKKLLIYFAIIAITVSIVFYGFSKYQENTLTLYGNVDIRDVTLSFRVPGRVNKLFFEEGDRITAGTILASLDQDIFSNDLNVAKQKLTEAQSSLDNAEKIYTRRSDLIKTGAISQALYDSALADRDQAAAKLTAAQTNVSQAEIALADTNLVAPSPGTIITRVQEQGAIVQNGQSIYVLSLDNPVWIRSYISEAYLGYIYPGKKVVVTTDSNGRYEGQIGFISPQAEFTPKTVETADLRTDLVYRLRIIIDNPDSGLRQGMPATIHLEKSTKQQ